MRTADERLRKNPSAVEDLQTLLAHYLQRAPSVRNFEQPVTEPLAIHAAYTRDEVLVALGYWSFTNRPKLREGVLHLTDKKLSILFVTLQKTESDYSPTTMYEDYLISHDQFHWQSQGSTSDQSAIGQRYVHHRSLGYTPLLFVREVKRLPSGLSAAYHFLGPCHYVSHTGNKPMSIVWQLEHAVPTRLARSFVRQIAV